MNGHSTIAIARLPLLSRAVIPPTSTRKPQSIDTIYYLLLFPIHNHHHHTRLVSTTTHSFPWKCHSSHPPSVIILKSPRRLRRHHPLHCPPRPLSIPSTITTTNTNTAQHSSSHNNIRIRSNILCNSSDRRFVHRRYSHRTIRSCSSSRHHNNIVHRWRALQCGHQFDLPPRCIATTTLA